MREHEKYCCGIDNYDPCLDCPAQTQPACPEATPAVSDTRANVEGFLLYIQGYQDALVVFSSMLEEVIGE